MVFGGGDFSISLIDLMKSRVILIFLLAHSFYGYGQNCFSGGLYRDTLFSDIEITELVYGSNVNFINQPDTLHATLYSPVDNVVTTRPLVFAVFGGSFVQGSREEYYIQQTCQNFARRGYLAVAIDYRIGMLSLSALDGFHAVFRGAQDCKAAVRFFRAHADFLVFDPNEIYMIGYSAGGFNAVHTAFWQTDEVPVFAFPPGSGTFETGTSTPGVADTLSGLISVAGGIGDTLWMNGERTAVACIHNLTDPVVPYQAGSLFGTPVTFGSSLFITNRAASQGNFSRMKTLNVPNMHLPDLGSPWADTISRYITTYMHEMLCRNRSDITATKPQPENQVQVGLRSDGLHISATQGGHCKIFNGAGKMLGHYFFGAGASLHQLPVLQSGIYRAVAITEGIVQSSSFIYLQ